MYVGTNFKNDNTVEIKTIKIELIKKYFDEKLSSIKLKPEKKNGSWNCIDYSFDKVINRFKSVFYKAFPKNKNQNKTW